MTELSIIPGLHTFGSAEEVTELQAINSGQDIVQKITQRMATEMASQLENAIFCCIDARLGPIWNPDEMGDRLRRITYQFEDYEDYTLDGKIMLRVWPIVYTRDGMKVSVHREVQAFP